MIKLFPEIILSAMQNELQTSGFKAWFIAKDYCQGRRGTIPAKDFRGHLASLGVCRATYSRWIKAALDLGLLKRIKGKRGGMVYYGLASWQAGAYIAGCKHLHPQPSMVDLAAFTSRSFINEVWAAYLKRFGNKPVSQAALSAMTKAAPRTQYNREKRAKVKQLSNVAIYGQAGEIAKNSPEIVMGVLDMPGGYVSKLTGDLCMRLPNSKVIPDNIQLVNPGRTFKVNNLLNRLFSALLPKSDAEAKKQTNNRRYSEGPNQTNKIKRNLRKYSIQGLITIYERWKPLYSGGQGWAACLV